MVRKQVYITGEQEAWLKRIAAERGLTEAEVIRTALDALTPLTYERSESSAGWIRETATMERYIAEGTQDGAGLALDEKLADAAWQKELDFMKSLGKRKAAGTEGEAWKFNREELYEERLAKILRRY